MANTASFFERLKALQNRQPTKPVAVPRADPDPKPCLVVPPNAMQRLHSEDELDRKCIVRGPAAVDAANDWNALPQWRQEFRQASESLDVIVGQGTITLDLARANAFLVQLTQNATIMLSGAPAIPGGQPDRDRVVPINVAVIRRGFNLAWDPAIKWPDGNDDFEYEGADTYDDFAFKGMVGPGVAQLGGGPGGIWYGYVTGLNRK